MDKLSLQMFSGKVPNPNTVKKVNELREAHNIEKLYREGAFTD